MSAVEYAGWSDHLTRYPPGDYLAQAILANLWSAVASYLSGKMQEPHLVAPWLEGSEQKSEREEKIGKARRAMRAGIVAGVYRESKEKPAPPRQ